MKIAVFLRRLIALIVVGTAAISFSAWADSPGCFSDGVFRYRDFENVSSLLSQKTQYIIGSEPKSARDFARQNNLAQAAVDQNFGATGSIECNGRQLGSASLVQKGNVLLTEAHIFTNPDTCTPVPEATNCVFVTSYLGKPIIRSFKHVESGFKGCPTSNTDDWEVLSLNSPIPNNIKPYSLAIPANPSPGDKYTGVNGVSADFFDRTKTGNAARPKSFSKCSFLGFSNDIRFGGLLGTSCSNAILSSGSTLLNNQNQMIGIQKSSTEDKVALKAKLAAAAADPNHAFSAQTCEPQLTNEPSKPECASYYVAITQHMIDVVNSAGN